MRLRTAFLRVEGTRTNTLPAIAAMGPPITRAIAALVLLAALCTPGAAALYQDQAGKNEWLRQFVGRARRATLARGRIFLATDAGALAALSLEAGSLVWRRVIGEGDGLAALHVSAKTLAVNTR